MSMDPGRHMRERRGDMSASENAGSLVRDEHGSSLVRESESRSEN